MDTATIIGLFIAFIAVVGGTGIAIWLILMRHIGRKEERLAKIEASLLLTLFYLNENSIEEISRITSIKIENIKMKLSRARKKMYMALEENLKLELNSII
jgi:Sigma-70, region 4